MAFLKTANRAESTLDGGINDAALSLDVAVGEGALFPAAGDFHITIEDEILVCTARAGDTLTVTRAAEGTIAAAHIDGKAVELRITKGVIDALETEIDAKVADADFTAAEEVMVGTGAGTHNQVTLAASQVLGMLAAGNTTNVTMAQLWAILSGAPAAAVDMNDQILQKVKGYLFTTATELTLDAAGAITVTQMVHTVDTESDDASDDLVTINGGTTVGLIIIRPAHTDRTVVVKDGGGNIELQGGADITLDDITDHMMLFWDTTNSKWVDFGGGSGDVATDAIWDAKGDLAVGTGANTAQKLTVGANRKRPEADSGETTGIKWSDPATVEATLTNKAGVNSVAGYVYRLDPDNNDSFDYASEDEDAQVVVTPAVINDNASGLAVLMGYTDVYVNGDTTRGQLLYFSSTSGQARPTWARDDGAFAQATADRSGAGVVKAYVFPRERIRKYQVTDESSWTKTLKLPLTRGASYASWSKSANNPLLAYGANNEWDEKAAAWGSVIYDPYDADETRRWKMYYTGRKDDANTTEQIGLAYATDPEGTWTKYGSNPVIVAETGDYKDKRASLASVIYDEYETDSAKKYKMWIYCKSNLDVKSVGYFYSSDGISWTASGSNPISITNYAFGQNVIRVGNLYWMAFVDTSSQISLAYSADGTTWTRKTTIIATGAGGAWDDTYVFYVAAYWNLGVWYAFYAGYETKYQIGYVYSSDGYTFTKFTENPILTTGSGGAWDDAQVLPSCVIQFNEKFYLFYSGNEGTNYRQGVAVIP